MSTSYVPRTGWLAVACQDGTNLCCNTEGWKHKYTACTESRWVLGCRRLSAYLLQCCIEGWLHQDTICTQWRQLAVALQDFSREKDLRLRSYSLKDFVALIFQQVPGLQPFGHQLEEIYAQFNAYKQVRCILLSSCTYLVKACLVFLQPSLASVRSQVHSLMPSRRLSRAIGGGYLQAAAYLNQLSRSNNWKASMHNAYKQPSSIPPHMPLVAPCLIHCLRSPLRVLLSSLVSIMTGCPG